MPQKQNPTAAGSRVSWNAFPSASAETHIAFLPALQLPPIIATHLWRSDELAAIEASAMIAGAVLGGAPHG